MGGLFSLDIDSKEIWDKVFKNHAYETLAVKTGSPEEHYRLYYTSRLEFPTKKLKVVLGKGKEKTVHEMEIMGYGTQSILPPSIHPDPPHKAYEIICDKPSAEWKGDPYIEVKEMLEEAFGVKIQLPKVDVHQLLEHGSEKGWRNYHTCALVTWFYRKGRSKQETTEIVLKWNLEKNNPPDEEEARAA